MGETTVTKRRTGLPEVTGKSTLINQIVEEMHNIKRLLLKMRPDEREALTNIVKFADTIESLSARALRGASSDLFRINAILTELEKWLKSPEFGYEDRTIMSKISQKIKYVKDLINITAQQFKFTEE